MSTNNQLTEMNDNLATQEQALQQANERLQQAQAQFNYDRDQAALDAEIAKHAQVVGLARQWGAYVKGQVDKMIEPDLYRRARQLHAAALQAQQDAPLDSRTLSRSLAPKGTYRMGI